MGTGAGEGGWKVVGFGVDGGRGRVLVGISVGRSGGCWGVWALLCGNENGRMRWCPSMHGDADRLSKSASSRTPFPHHCAPPSRPSPNSYSSSYSPIWTSTPRPQSPAFWPPSPKRLPYPWSFIISVIFWWVIGGFVGAAVGGGWIGGAGWKGWFGVRTGYGGGWLAVKWGRWGRASGRGRWEGAGVIAGGVVGW